MSVELFILFATATATFAFMPGPAILYVVARTLSDGRRAGLLASLGVHVGGYAHVIAAVAGLAIVLETIPLLYSGLKLAGALYLIWLGIGILRARMANEAASLPTAPAASFRQSVLVEVLNPKAALFYVAFLPQFTTPEAAMSLPVQLAILGIIVNIAFSLADVVYVLAADGVHRRLANTSVVLWVRRMGGALLIALGLNLAFSRT